MCRLPRLSCRSCFAWTSDATCAVRTRCKSPCTAFRTYSVTQSTVLCCEARCTSWTTPDVSQSCHVPCSACSTQSRFGIYGESLCFLFNRSYVKKATPNMPIKIQEVSRYRRNQDTFFIVHNFAKKSDIFHSRFLNFKRCHAPSFKPLGTSIAPWLLKYDAKRHRGACSVHIGWLRSIRQGPHR